MATEQLGFQELTSAQSNKFVTYNRNLRQLEATMVSADSRTNGGPPGAPAEGSVYIVDVATGDWSSFGVNSIAQYTLGIWRNYAVAEGMRLWIRDEDELVTYNGTAWSIITVNLGGLDHGSIVYMSGGALTTDPSFTYAEVSQFFTDWVVITASQTAVAGSKFFADTATGNITVTLPATPNLGEKVTVMDVTLPANQTNGQTDNQLIIDNNGNLLEGVSQTIESRLPGKQFELIYAGASYGWRLVK